LSEISGVELQKVRAKAANLSKDRFRTSEFGKSAQSKTPNSVSKTTVTHLDLPAVPWLPFNRREIFQARKQ